jgi:parallel beta-helix repeat protein
LIRRALSGMIVTLMLISVALAFGILPSVAPEDDYAIYIRADGSISPPTAPIQRIGDVYTFTEDIEFLSIVVERNNTIVDGNDHTLYGIAPDRGLYLHRTSNVTVRKWEIEGHLFGIFLNDSSNNKIHSNRIHSGVGIYLLRSNNNSIYGNTVTRNSFGIGLSGSSKNVISGNNITNNSVGIVRYWPSNNNNISGNTITDNGDGISLLGSSMEFAGNEVISGNNVTHNGYGINLIASSNNSISGNNIASNLHGIRLGFESSNNRIHGNNIAENGVGWYSLKGEGINLVYNSSGNSIYHNNLINNLRQVTDDSWDETYLLPSTNTWDKGFPSGGNYWSDYTSRHPSAQELDASGIWDTPYLIDENNQDNYPLMEPWTPAQPSIVAHFDIDADVLKLKSRGKWVNAYIQLPEGYDPADIDSSTIMLNGTIPPILNLKYGFVKNPSEYLRDCNNDGILERIVRFDRATLESWICQNVGMQSEISLTVTGKLKDGTQFSGAHTINILWQAHKSPSKR